MTARALRLLLALGFVLAACSASAVERPTSEPMTAPPIAVVDPPRTAPTASPSASPVPTPRPTVTPSPSATLAPTPAARTAFALDLYVDGDFVPQHTFEWCVGASIQMAHNLVSREKRASREDQAELWELARSHSVDSFNGANPRGWAAALNEIGLGPYEVVSIPDYDEALRTAAAAMRVTERPVGLVMWRGRHAWVMSGFESVGDPAVHPDFEVTGIRVLDPLFPHGSGAWGSSPQPNSLLTPDELAAQFVVREARRWSSDLGTGHLLVLPASG